MIVKNLIWYLGYGSNLSRERFLCYITGGQPIGNVKSYEGCRDKTHPALYKPFIITNELYFSQHSQSWNGGGVAFISINESELQTYGILYLITRQQLEDIAKQETSSDEVQTINFDEAILNGNTIFKRNSWYGKVLHLGFDNNYPIFTLTSEKNLEETTKPSQEYIATIIKGLNETFKLSRQDIINYFVTKRGIADNYSVDELTNITDTTMKTK